MKKQRINTSLVGVIGFEPTASSSRTKRATGLRYTPKKTAEIIKHALDEYIEKFKKKHGIK